MWAASAGTIAYCSKKVRAEMDDKKIPLMGVLGAFIFAAQMINFTIPATGSSGHLGGGLLLAILLGPYAAFLTIASVLTVQALFFADGGLLALGCNIFNLGIFPAFIAYPLIYRKIVCDQPSRGRIAVAAMISAVAGLQMGAFGVVLETVASGISSLPFSTFITLMQPIHLAIGIVEGMVTASVVTFVYKARPEILQCASITKPIGNFPIKNTVLTFLAAALVIGGLTSWYASERPDGLEWSIRKITGSENVVASKNGVHGALAGLQDKTALLPDYNFKEPDALKTESAIKPAAETNKEAKNKLGRSVSGVLGGFITLALAALIGFILKKRTQEN
jgi:cobalt/nickel transport system permease protein